MRGIIISIDVTIAFGSTQYIIQYNEPLKNVNFCCKYNPFIDFLSLLILWMSYKHTWGIVSSLLRNIKPLCLYVSISHVPKIKY